ncbi:SDR family oxidoreductase [Acidovorax sp. CCYZU-2555]|uniref:SDR family NAD(P)-dependent oxidoreductase n=1 Tax=Acidovorax sp. CCYZU-2555 TaxID=2835042 RepID=UPI001BCCD8B1|nr:SDR family oxidoreductase [Acidovorax sp. CCYZU-2555]MBS7777534.1 SDR family oxidoreductase [Acidovorax sp. CCYZU-2555]
MSEPTQHSPLRGKIALVTGGSNGIGAATVRALANEGATVVIGYHQSLERAASLGAQLPGPQHTLRIALEEQASHAAAAQWLSQTFGRLDVLVNSAGFTQRIAHADTDALEPDLFNSILCANVGGTYAVTRALLPLLRQSDNAVVVNVSSVSAFTGLGSNMAYCAAKAGLDTLTISMARAFGPVRFLCVSPASVDTDFVGGRSRAELEKKAAQTPLGRVVAPEDVAQAVLACVTHLRTSTGARIVIDGGHSL